MLWSIRETPEGDEGAKGWKIWERVRMVGDGRGWAGEVGECGFGVFWGVDV